MRKRILASMLSLCVILAFLPVWSAATDDLANGDPHPQNTEDPGPLNIADGGIIFTETGYRQENAASEVTYNGPYTVSGTGTDTITVESGAEIDLTISNLDIDAENAPVIYVQAGATLHLTVEGNNSLTGGPGFAAICVEPAYDENWNYDAAGSAELYISGSGSLTAEGGDGDATAGTYGGGAGIGGNGEDQNGGDSVDFGLICIEPTFTGTLDATGGNASVYEDGANCFGGGAGIGGGAICDGGYISISSATVAAEAGANEDSMGAAGIGGGNDSSVSSVIISGGAQVTAIAHGGAAGIGGGTNTSYSNVHYGDMNGALTPERVGVISISGEGTTVSARGGTNEGYSGNYGGAGIGSGYPTGNNARSVAFDISITNGASVRAYGGYHAQAIGYGYRPTDFIGYGITLELDDTIFLWAQNADYYQPALVATTEYDNGRTPVSYSSGNNIYLTHYVDENKDATSAALSTVPGYLKQPTDAANETFDWAFDETKGTVTIGPVTVVDDVTGLNGNWATLCTVPPEEPITIALADLIIYVGGDGYESVVTDKDGKPVETVSNGLPEPGFTVELPAAIDAALKKAADHTSSDPLDLSGYLSFAYDDGAGTTRTWTLEHYDNKAGNTSMAGGRYIYRIVPVKGQDPVRLQFTDENNDTTISDEFEIELADQYQVYEMTIYPGALDPAHLQAVVTFPDSSLQTYDLAVDPADLIIRGVVDEDDPTTTIVTTAPEAAVDDMTAQVPADTLFYINESTLEVKNWNAVKLLTDHIVPEAQEILLDRALDDFASRLTEEYNYEFRYLDLVDTSNGNVWVTASEPVTVYWPYPDGTDKDTEFFIVHYHDLDRQYDEDLT